MRYNFVRYLWVMLPMRVMPSADGRLMRRLYRERVSRGLVVCADARAAAYPIDPDFPPEWGCLSVAAVRNGREEYRFPSTGRTLTVDDDTYLVLHPESRYSYRLRSLGVARCIMVSFPLWMMDAAAGQLTDDVDEGLCADDAGEAWAPGREHLASHDERISRELRAIERACIDGVVGSEWYHQQMAVLLTRVLETLAHGAELRPRRTTLRRRTRHELVRRARLASDLIHQSYGEPVDLAALGAAAGLSPYHLLRVFKEVYGVTPQEFLQRKRAAVARRMLQRTKLSTGAIASRVGFQSRSSLYRWMRRAYGNEWRAGPDSAGFG